MAYRRSLPFDRELIMNYWPNWRHLTKEQADGVFRGLNALTEHTRFNGQIDDEVIEQHVGQFVSDIIPALYRHPHLHDLFVNRCRTTWLNHAETIKRRQENVDRKTEQAASLVAKRQAIVERKAQAEIDKVQKQEAKAVKKRAREEEAAAKIATKITKLTK